MIKLLTLALVATTAWAANNDHVLIFSLNSGQSEAPIGDKGVRFTVQEYLHARSSGLRSPPSALAVFPPPPRRGAKTLGLPYPPSVLLPRTPTHDERLAARAGCSSHTTLTHAVPRSPHSHAPRRSSLSPAPAGEQRLLAWQDAKADSLAHHHHARRQPDD